MFTVLYIAYVVTGFASLACWIIEIVAAFKKEEKPLMGILSLLLCGIGGLVIGWVHATEWGIKRVMVIWTSCVAICLMTWAIGGFVFVQAVSDSTGAYDQNTAQGSKLMQDFSERSNCLNGCNSVSDFKAKMECIQDCSK